MKWLARFAATRARNDARLLLVVVGVVLVSCTSIASLALVVAVTEEEGLRTALSRADPDRTSINVRIDQPSVSIVEGERAAGLAVEYLFTDSVVTSSETFAQSSVTPVSGLNYPEPVSAYFGELTTIESAGILLDGEWPADEGVAEAIPVAVPESAANALRLSPGDSLAVGDTIVQVVGIYRVSEPDSALWASDLLGAGGIGRGFNLPRSSTFTVGDVIGPLVVSPQSLDQVVPALGVVVETLDIRVQPDFDTVDLTNIGVISDRLGEAGKRVPARMGDTGEQVGYSSQLAIVIDDAAASLLLTRSTIITVGLLLVLVAIVSLVQTARLLVDSRLDERRLLRARGASVAGIRGMSGVEAAAIGLVATVVSPLLASVAYRALAAQPAMVAAGMPSESGLPPVVWLVSSGVCLAFIGVLLAPLVRPAELFDDDRSASRAARGIRSLGFMRLGLNLGIAACAILAYQQLVTYRPSVSAPSVRIDPILVLAPTVLLATCAVLAIRAVPIVATAFERVGSRSPGAILSLASWEVGRRSRQLTAVVLLLTVSLGAGSFGATFLATWRQSQADQVMFAFGAPARVAADLRLSSTQAVVLAGGAQRDPEPVIRRLGQLTGPSAGGVGGAAPRGPQTQVLALTAPARSLIDRGRNGVEGGSTIEQALAQDQSESQSVDLPLSAAGVSADVRIDSGTAPLPGVAAIVTAIVEDERGLLSGLRLGAVPVDGAEHPVRGYLPEATTELEPGAVRGIVGIVVDFAVTDRSALTPREDTTSVDVYFQDVSSVSGVSGEATATALEPLLLESLSTWSVQSAAETQTPPQLINTPTGSQLGLRVSIPSDVDSPGGVYSLTGWKPSGVVPLVATSDLATSMALREGTRLTLLVSDVAIQAELVGVVPLVPGGQAAADRDAGSRVSSVVVLDQVLLSRELLSAGAPVSTVDEWWVDVAPGAGAAYIQRHQGEEGNTSVSSAEVVVLEQSEGPLRIATIVSLWIVIGAAVLLTAAGFAVHTAASMRSRRTEFAQLRALGLARRSLVTVIGTESLLISALGTVFGLAIGVLLGSTVAALVGVSPDGSAPQPAVQVIVPFGFIAALALTVALLVVSVVLAIAWRQRSADPASILRGANE